MKKIIRSLLKLAGIEVRRIRNFPAAGSESRPVGAMEMLLEDLRFRGVTCRTILDVGAHKGNWSVMARQYFPQAEFILIEPQVEMEAHLRSFCETSPGSKYFLAGAGPRSTNSVLTIWDDLAGSSFRPHADGNLLDKGTQRTVEVLSIDDLIAQGKVNSPQLVKIDTQGYELDVLEGAKSTFGATEVFIIETSFYSFSDVPGMPVFSEVINYMKERGYVAYDFAGFLRRPLDGALGQCDICFVKQDGFLRKSNDWS